MTDLLMPSEVKKAAGAGGGPGATTTLHPPEPPSVKLLVRLFLIPLLIVGASVGVVYLFGLMTGGTPSFEDSLKGLEEAGGKRTGGWLVGPGSKQRYMFAKTLTDKMKSGLTEAERVKLASRLTDILDHHTA